LGKGGAKVAKENLEKYAQAERLFFIESKNFKEISHIVGLTTKTISTYLRQHPSFDLEKKKQTHQKRGKRKKYQKEWINKKRNKQKHATGHLGNHEVEKAILKRQHNIDVQILSSDRF
jgi:hypothetical protein